MTTDATELMNLVVERDRLAKIVEVHETALSDVTARIAAECHHPITVRKEHYSSGGYDYVSEESSWDECTICGKHLNVKTKRGGYA